MAAHSDHGRHRTENLLAIYPDLWRAVGEERGRPVVAVGVALEALAAASEPGAFLAADLDVLQVLVELPLIDDGADLGALLERVVDDQRLHARDHRVHEAIVDAFGDNES